MDLRDLYQEVILDHNKRPRNFGTLDEASHATGHNPMCGDRVCVYVRMENGTVGQVRFTGTGCAISKASASLMTEAVTGKSREDVRAMFVDFQDVVTGRAVADDERLGKLAVLAGVCEYPSRVKCAMLAWHALQSAIDGAATTVTTE